MAGSDNNVHDRMILEVGKIQQTVQLMLNKDLSPNAAYRSLDKLCHGLKDQVAEYVNASNAHRAYESRQYHQLPPPPYLNPPPGLGPPPQGHPHMNPQHQPMMLGPGYHHHPHQPPPPPPPPPHPGMFAVAENPRQYSPPTEYGPPPGTTPEQRPALTEKPLPQQINNQIVESTSQSVHGKEESALALVRKINKGSSKKNVKRCKMDLEKANKERMQLPYQCMLCNKRFATSTQNRRHQLTHIKPYSCNACGHKSAEKVKIRLHCWKTHGDREIFTYTAPGCSTDVEGDLQHMGRDENDADSCDSYDLDITSNGDDSMDPLGGISPRHSIRSRLDDDEDTDEKPYACFGRLGSESGDAGELN